VKFAIHIHNFGVFADPRLIGQIAGEADQAGWDGVFVADHLLQHWQDAPQPIADPWIALSAIALATRRARIGPMVTPLPRRRPWQLVASASRSTGSPTAASCSASARASATSSRRSARRPTCAAARRCSTKGSTS